MRFILILILSVFGGSMVAQSTITKLPTKTVLDLMSQDNQKHTIPCPHQSWRLLPPYHLQIDLFIDTTQFNPKNLTGFITGPHVGREIIIYDAELNSTEISPCNAENIWDWVDCVAPYVVKDLHEVYLKSTFELINTSNLGYEYMFHTATVFRPFTRLRIRDSRFANDPFIQNPYFGWYRKIRSDNTIAAVKQLSNIEWQVSFALFMQ